MSEVFQDSDAIGKIAENIEKEDAEELQKLIERLFSLLEEKLGEEDDGKKAWFGPKASQFLKNCRDKKEKFENQPRAITEVGRNLGRQAEAWARFETIN